VAIEVVNRQRLARIDARRVANLADATLGAVGRPGANLTVAFVRDRGIQELNLRFRGKDRATDVLSFPAADERTDTGAVFLPGDLSEFLGDIVISTDAALRQADDAGCSFEREVDELVIHGVLHLCDYDHETDGGQMNRLELKLRRKLLDNQGRRD
jgi:probable rRNA maturation factor